MKPSSGKSRKWLPGILCAVLVVATLAAVGWWLLPKPPLLEDVAFSRAIYDRYGTLLRVTLTADEKFRVFVPLAEISPEMVNVTIFQEDRFFRHHPGINPFSVARAAAGRLGLGSGRGGASTVSMQLARLRYHLPTRTLMGKFAQMLRALQLERHYTKSQILEAYLNLTPVGGNVEGVGAASLLYFGKSPAALSLPEAVALGVIPQSPARRTPRIDRENPELNAAHRRLWSRLKAVRPDLDPLGADFIFVASRRPFAAPHFTSQILRTPSASTSPSVAVRTTLDRNLQQLLERRIADFVGARESHGVHNAAALLIDPQSMEVLAQVGSADFFDAAIDGQVDGTRGRRSPGSALKPFVYALALDQGLVHPNTLLADAPRRFGDYDPENFDRDFAGPIRVADALTRSRNVPAIALAARLSTPTLYEFLIRAGVGLTRSESEYGLTLPLGGAEVTMEELVRLYATLANRGISRPVRRQADDGLSPGNRVLTPESAYLTLEMLRQNPAPGGHAGGVAWKTGTSNGFCDAWAIAVTNRYVLAVWVGNFNGRRNAAFVGGATAGPLLFQMLDALRAHDDADPGATTGPTGLNVRKVELCAVSGQLPTAACRHRVDGWFIPGVSPIAACEIHREILVDIATGLRVSADDGTRALRRDVYEFWPHDLLALFRQAGVPRRLAPPFAPGAGPEMDATEGAPQPRILSPRGDRTYLSRASDEGNVDRGIVLRAQATADATKIYWFADRVFLGTSASLEPLSWQPGPGRYHLRALDDRGRSATCLVTLQAAR
jgi:penicillin-binding protein 1C